MPTQFGCTASPTISLPGLKVNAANGNPIALSVREQLAGPHPVRPGLAGWLLRKEHNPFNYSWQKPVSALNVTFQGPSLSDVAVAPQG